MPTFLEIVVNVPQARPSTGAGSSTRGREAFHYHLPPELEGQVHVGHLVEVPFGRQRVQGVVIGEVNEPAVPQTKAVLGLIDPQPVLTPYQLALAQHLAQGALAPLSRYVNLMVPTGLSQMADTRYAISEQFSGVGEDGVESQPEGRPKLTDFQKRLMGLLERRGPLRGRQIDRALPRFNWRVVAHSLVRRGLLTTQSVLLPPTVQPKLVRTAQLACPPEVAEAELPNLGRRDSQALKRRQSMLRFLLREPGAVDVAWVYAESGGNISDLQLLAERGLITLGESEVWRDPLAEMEFVPSDPPMLTRDQESVWDVVCAGLRDVMAGLSVPPFLLHGVTGSGKTEVYLRAVEEILRLGRQAIILVPEIALTPQTVRRFVSRFPGRVGLTHSGLTAGERYDTWRRARAGLISLVVGPRSALFTPFPNLGLIVVDECHDGSYYQSEPPFYHAREAAITCARLAGAVCLLGSATPDVVSRYFAEQKHYHYLNLPARILAHRQAVQAQVERLGLASRYRAFEGQAETQDLPPVRVVDMRRELKAGNRSIFSQPLQTALAQVLEDGQQAILFLNRRGMATYVFCRDCGHVLECPRCDLPLTYHIRGRQRAEAQTASSLSTRQSSALQLICHHCFYARKMPSTCPQCKSARIRHYGTGTERVETEVQALFPQARTLRWDFETTRQKGAHESILSHFIAHRADVLIGTQMLAKGLDLPLVTLVGVVLADVGLNMPDYRAGERTFQVLVQVAGRAGRSPLGGQVILQTFQPDHYVIRAAAQHDYDGFCRQELDYRRRLGYPPFSRLVRLEFRHRDAAQAESAAQKMAERLRGWLASEARRATQIIGPSPCFFGRVAGVYRWQIILRSPNPASVLRDKPLEEWRVEVDPLSLL